MKTLHLLKLLFTCLTALTVISCTKKEDVQPDTSVPIQDKCVFLQQTNSTNTFSNTFYTYDSKSKKLIEMRRSNYYYQFTYNTQGKISDSKVFLVETNKPVNTQLPDSLAPFDRYFWEGNNLVKKNELKRDGTLRTEYLNTFDNQGRLVSVKILSVNFPTRIIEYEYDSNSRLSKRTDRLSGTQNGKDYINEVIFVESYEYANNPAKHPESLLKDSGLPYDILGNDPWNEWVTSKIIRQRYNYQSGRLEPPTEIKVSATKTSTENLATEITTEEMVIAFEQSVPSIGTTIYSIFLNCS